METDIADIPLTDEDYVKRAQNLSQKELDFICNPCPYDSLVQEYLDLHNTLQHIDKQSFFRLVEQGDLPKKFLSLKKNPPI